MEQLASPGSTLLTAETLRLVEGLVQVTPLGPVPVKGLDTPVEVFELVGRECAAGALPGRAWPGADALCGRVTRSWRPCARRSAGLERARARWWR